MAGSPAQDGTRADNQQAAQGSFAHLRGRTQLLLAAGRMLEGGQPHPEGGEIAASLQSESHVRGAHVQAPLRALTDAPALPPRLSRPQRALSFAEFVEKVRPSQISRLRAQDRSCTLKLESMVHSR